VSKAAQGIIIGNVEDTMIKAVKHMVMKTAKKEVNKETGINQIKEEI
jgi:hypothetical protein